MIMGYPKIPWLFTVITWVLLIYLRTLCNILRPNTLRLDITSLGILLKKKIVCLEYIPTERQNTDIFTKPLDRSKFETLRQVIDVILCPWTVLFSWSLYFIAYPLWPLFFVPWFLCFSFLSLGFALLYIHAFHSKCFFFLFNNK